MLQYLFLLVLLIVMVVAMICVSGRYVEKLNIAQVETVALPTIVGGTTTSKISFSSGASSAVRKLLGDSDQTIILLHNSPLNLLVWQPLFIYAQSVKNAGGKIPNIICYDLLGHGTNWVSVPTQYNDADPNNHAWNFSDYVSELNDVYSKYVGTGKVTVAGYGFGGLVAQEYALAHPDTVDKLVVIATGVGPVTASGLREETTYVANWIATHANVAQTAYLTLNQGFIDQALCMWFENSNPLICPYPANRQDTSETYNTMEYIFAQKLYREASATTYLQVDKLIAIEDLANKWDAAAVDFTVQWLVTDRDEFINVDNLEQDLKVVKRAAPLVTLTVAEGKYGFPITNPAYIYNVLVGKDMSGDALTVQVEQI